jgi:hypothetical protein
MLYRKTIINLALNVIVGTTLGQKGTLLDKCLLSHRVLR